MHCGTLIALAIDPAEAPKSKTMMLFKATTRMITSLALRQRLEACMRSTEQELEKEVSNRLLLVTQLQANMSAHVEAVPHTLPLDLLATTSSILDSMTAANTAAQAGHCQLSSVIEGTRILVSC